MFRSTFILSNCAVMTASNLERSHTVMIPTIALPVYYSGVGVWSLHCLFYFTVLCFFVFFLLPLSFSLIGCRDHAYTIPFMFNFHSFLHATMLIVLLHHPFSVSICS